MATVFSLMAERVVASVRVKNTGKPVRIMLGGLRAYAFTLKVRAQYNTVGTSFARELIGTTR